VSETPLYCVSDIVTLRSKVELHLFSHQRFNYCCAEKNIVYLHSYTPLFLSKPIQYLPKMDGKTGIFFLLYC